MASRVKDAKAGGGNCSSVSTCCITKDLLGETRKGSENIPSGDTTRLPLCKNVIVHNGPRRLWQTIVRSVVAFHFPFKGSNQLPLSNLTAALRGRPSPKVLTDPKSFLAKRGVSDSTNFVSSCTTYKNGIISDI